MSRQEKRTRIRVISPKLQLRGQDALTGSYPTNVRFSLDGRTGNYKVGYNDVQTIVFGSRSNGTSWQDNMIGYWTMQRLGLTDSSVGNVTFESELSGSIGNGIFPFLDYNSARLASKYFTSIGVSQSYGHYGKGYDVNLYNASPVAPIKPPNTFPYLEPNKSYDFNPYFSAYGIMKADPMLITATDSPLLIQNLDADKTLFEFSNFTGPYPKGYFDNFTIAGWFYYNSSNQNAVNSHILVAGPCRKDPWGVEYVDYYAGAIEDGAGGLKFQVSFISSSYSADSIQLDTDSVPDLVGKWYHFAFTYNGRGTYTVPPFDINSIKVYTNGELVNPNAISANGGGFNGYNTDTAVELGLSSGYLFGLNANITGSIGELAVFDRVLTADEIAEIYYSQVPLHKKRRVIAGTSIDLDNDPYPVDAGEYMTTFNRDGMLVTGSIVKGIGDNQEWVHFSPGQEMQPFHDQLQYAADAKGDSIQNPFFATGSAITDVGEGFNSPLWSKNKIEIPIPVATNTQLSVNTGKLGNKFETSYNSPMAYYNFQTNIWEPIGVGLPLNVTSSLEDYYGYYPVGFPNSLLPIAVTKGDVSNIGYTGNGFGFPFHPKFHATGSQTLNISNYITEPFVLEKAVLEMGNLTYELSDIDPTVISSVKPISASCATFFILNQRYNQNFNYNFTFNDGAITPVSASVPSDYCLTKDDFDLNQTTRIDTVRDIVGFSQLFSVASLTPLKDLGFLTSNLQDLLPITSNDVVVRSQVPNYLGVQYVNVRPVFSMSMGSPTLGPNAIGVNFLQYYNNLASSTKKQVFGYDGYRNGLSMLQPTTRGLTNDLFASYNLQPQLTAIASIDIQWPAEKFKINPYILNPKDKLILGFQMPVSQYPVAYINTSAAGIESTFTIHETVSQNLPAKLVLYGSYIRGNKEYNDGTNQLLSSDGIHEVIE